MEDIKKSISIPSVEIDSINFVLHKSRVPSVEISHRMQAYRYGNISASRWFIPVNPCRDSPRNMSKRRSNDIFISQSYTDIDSIEIKLPSNMKVEALPKPLSLTSKFGKVSSKIIPSNDKITIVQQFVLNTGKFSKKEGEELSKLVKSAKEIYSSAIVLVKKE